MPQQGKPVGADPEIQLFGRIVDNKFVLRQVDIFHRMGNSRRVILTESVQKPECGGDDQANQKYGQVAVGK